MFTKYIEEKYKVEGLNLDITKGEIKQVSKFRDHWTFESTKGEIQQVSNFRDQNDILTKSKWSPVEFGFS